jgi:hypothetical protein
MSQRYVQLKLTAAPSVVSSRLRSVTALMPIDGYYAPPGYYLLVAVDSHNKPSYAVWIKVAVS